MYALSTKPVKEETRHERIMNRDMAARGITLHSYFICDLETVKLLSLVVVERVLNCCPRVFDCSKIIYEITALLPDELMLMDNIVRQKKNKKLVIDSTIESMDVLCIRKNPVNLDSR